MTSLGKWSSTTLTTVLSTELNSLGNGSLATSGSAYDNTSALNLYADIELVLAALSPGAGASVSIYFLVSVDGTNFPSPSATDLALTSTQLAFTLPLGTTASTAQRVCIRQVPISPVKMNIGLINNASVALASSGNTLKLLAYGINLNG